MSPETKPLYDFTASEIVRGITTGKFTCEAVARACLERIEEREPEVQAWQYLNPDHVLEQARSLDQRQPQGALLGVPVGVKDIIDTCDMPTEYGSPIYKNHQPHIDAACLALSRRAGALVMGKTVTTEFANVYPGKTRHPFDSSRTPGGSSSGSGAAVGDHMVPLALGTQTTASTIRPASFCGIFGYRPSYGDVRCVGVKESSGSMDTLGLLARSLEDIALYRDVLVRREPESLVTPATAPRIGFCHAHLWDRLEPSTAHLLEGVADQLANSGAQVDELTLPSELDGIAEIHRTISSYEFARNFSYEIEHHWDELSEAVRNGRIAAGLEYSVEDYQQARYAAETCRRVLDGVFDQYDVLLTASASGEAPVGLQSTGDPTFCTLWTTAHVPSVSIPVLTGPNGLPIGAQLIGKRYADRRLLSSAQWIWQQLTSASGAV